MLQCFLYGTEGGGGWMDDVTAVFMLSETSARRHDLQVSHKSLQRAGDHGRQLESLGHKHDEMQARSREVSEAQGTGCRVVISMEASS